MKIVVCAKQVPDTTEVRIDPVTNTLIRDGVPSILNPDDAIALETAVNLRSSFPGSEVYVITMGPIQASKMLRECLARGADHVILLNGREFAGGDTFVTAYTLAAAIRKLGDVGLIITGRQAIDGDTAQVGPQLAERLGIPQVTYAERISSIEGDVLTVDRQTGDGYERVRIALPALLTAIKGLSEPGYMNVLGIIEAYNKDIQIWTIDDIGLKPEETGLKASPTKVQRSFTPAPKGAGVVWESDAGSMAKELIKALNERHALREGIIQ